MPSPPQPNCLRRRRPVPDPRRPVPVVGHPIADDLSPTTPCSHHASRPTAAVTTVSPTPSTLTTRPGCTTHKTRRSLPHPNIPLPKPLARLSRRSFLTAQHRRPSPHSSSVLRLHISPTPSPLLLRQETPLGPIPQLQTPSTHQNPVFAREHPLLPTNQPLLQARLIPIPRPPTKILSQRPSVPSPRTQKQRAARAPRTTRPNHRQHTRRVTAPFSLSHT